MDENYLTLDNLVVYQQTREYSRQAWQIYERLRWQQKKIIGDQMITSVDSVGANTAEGYGRFHYLDKIKFYYNARGSLLESKHWIELFYERKIVNQAELNKMIKLQSEILLKLNLLIQSQYKRKTQS
ncbi:MAG: four helix bundle protein [Candidatus Magasanikbacteria bacterium]|nr:four helix bundle protein [Candidatus Magasanikbacteria bacterium]